jgi:hypothetical protein
MIIKIVCKIRHQLNVRVFIWDCNKNIRSKSKCDQLKNKTREKLKKIQLKKINRR